MNKVCVPPLKIQGIKTKLVYDIQDCVAWDYNGTYFEPFMGSGVVGFNLAPKRAVFSDNNPHIINFYNSIKDKIITKDSAKNYLQEQDALLQRYGVEHYKMVRDRFNKEFNSFDFLFLNRCCFNGLMRFNSRGKFNVPYCKKDNRFSKSYITKIINQVDWVARLIANNDYKFICCDFKEILSLVEIGDFIYCDPPYIDRHSDYFNTWREKDERILYLLLKTIKAKFILSTWHSNIYRTNTYVNELWKDFSLKTIDHFYHLGASENNRNSIKEILATN